MDLPDIEYHAAATLEDASRLMQRHAPHARFLAGGTDLLVDLRVGRISLGHVISLTRIDALRGLSVTNRGLRIGALSTINKLAHSPIVRERWAPLLDAAGQMAAPQIRNVATVGGNLASAVPCADLPPILMVLEATVTLWSPGGERTVPVDAFFLGPRQTVMHDDELLTAVEVPPLPAGFGAAYARLGLRDGNAIAVAGVAAALQLDAHDAVQRARIALGAVAPIPKRVRAAEAALIGDSADENAFEQAAQAALQAAEPLSDIRGSAEYRRRMVGVLTRRALAMAHRRAQEAR